MSHQELFSLWSANAVDDNDLVEELKQIEGNEEEIFERFYRNLEFGTAGIRGVLGAGTNRMNIYVVREATQGLANYLNKKYKNAQVAISYDSRIKADVFAKEAAMVLAGNGIKVFITKELQPVAVLSYCVRSLKCQAGIMVTASHNPAKYNGYKCYGDDGCQMTDESADAVYGEIQNVDCFNTVKLADFDKSIESGIISYVDNSTYDDYLENVKAQTVNEGICENSDFSVVYTPLNGAGNVPVRRILDMIGVKNIHLVKEQELPDGNFPTCPYPNPEMKEALQKGLDLCYEVKPDLLLATDPDADRVGIAAKDGDGYRLMSGNETGVMLTNYILSCKAQQNKLPLNPIVVKTIVTTVLTNKICEKYGCELVDVLTGFKYIGDVILKLEEKQEENRYIFGYEESYGYLSGTYVRDKDAIVASMLICEMAAYYKKQGLTLSQVMDSIYEEYGYYKNTTLSYSFDGASGMEQMKKIMNDLHNEDVTEIAGFKVTKVSNYEKSIAKDIVSGEQTVINLPKANVISYTLENNNAVIVRPSGTEPKIKLYITAVGKNLDDANEITKNLQKHGENMLGV